MPFAMATASSSSLEAEEWSHRSEGLFRRQQHVDGRIAKQDRPGILLFRHRFARRRRPAHLLQGIGDVPLIFSMAAPLIIGPIADTLLRAGADLHLRDPAGELCRERVIDAGLHKDPVGADTGLAAIPEFRRDRPLDRQIEIGIVEHDERRIAAKLEAEPRMLSAAPFISSAPTWVEPVKEILRTVSFAISSLPISAGRPVTMLITPAGIPARSAKTPNARAEKG